MKKFVFVLLISFPILLSAQTTFASLGPTDSGGSGYKTVSTNSNIIVSNVMVNDGTDMYYSSATNQSGYTVGPFSIKANGSGTKVFTFEGMNFRGYYSLTVDAAHSSIVFKDINGSTIQTMTLNSNKSLTSSSTSVASFFDNGTTVPINNVAEIIVEVYENSGVANQQNSANFNYVDITLSNYAMPVELTAFNANIKDDTIELNWETATEVNNYGFEIERTTPHPPPYQGGSGEAGGGWEKIGFVQGHGNSNSPKEYSFTDKPDNSGKFQYRLKQIDNDGKFEYSPVVEINLEIPAEFSVKQNYPNPFNPTTTINYSVPSVGISFMKFVQIKVYDILGNEVATLVNEEKQPGNYEVEFNAGNLSSGIYFYQIVSGKYSAIKKMIVLK